MSLTKKEQKTLYKTRLRNIKRKYAKLIQHADLDEQARELKCEIDNLENLISQL